MLFHFSNVKDINSVLEVTVFDEDPDYKVEFLGKVAIPLLSINNGAQKWYSLKDKKLMSRAKGNNPRVLLEMRLIWNPVSLLNSKRILCHMQLNIISSFVKFRYERSSGH